MFMILCLLPACLLVSCANNDIQEPTELKCVEYKFGIDMVITHNDVIRMCEETKADFVLMTNQTPYNTTEECILKLNKMIGLECIKWA